MIGCFIADNPVIVLQTADTAEKSPSTAVTQLWMRQAIGVNPQAITHSIGGHSVTQLPVSSLVNFMIPKLLLIELFPRAPLPRPSPLDQRFIATFAHA